MDKQVKSDEMLTLSACMSRLVLAATERHKLSHPHIIKPSFSSGMLDPAP